jgi:hypothetical protein
MTAVTAMEGWSKPPRSAAPARLIFLSRVRATALASPAVAEVDARDWRQSAAVESSSPWKPAYSGE